MFASPVQQTLPEMTRSRSPKREICEVPPLEAWTVAGLAGSPGEVQTAAISYKNGPVQLTMKQVFSPFEPSSMDGSVHRQTITLRMNKFWESILRDLEQSLVQRVSTESAKILGCDLTAEEVLQMYRSCTRKRGEYPMNIRAKINQTGMLATRYWGAGGDRQDAPAMYAGKYFNAVLTIRALWRGEDAWGVVCDCTDLQEAQAGDDVACPF